MNVARKASDILKDRYVKGDPEREAAIQKEREEAAKPDMVNHPPHYTFGGIEVLDAIEAWELNYRRGNVVKYLVRAGRKSKFTELEDLKKAQFYLAREIEKMEAARALQERLRQELVEKMSQAAAAPHVVHTKNEDGEWKNVAGKDWTFQYTAKIVEPKKKRKGRKKR